MSLWNNLLSQIKYVNAFILFNLSFNFDHDNKDIKEMPRATFVPCLDEFSA